MFLRAAAGALFGAFLAPAALALFTFCRPSVVLDFNADLPRAITAGFHAVERTPDHTFAWTTPLATITLRGIHRDAAWTCVVRMRGARPSGLQPEVRLGVDGTTRTTARAGHTYEDVTVDIPPQPGTDGMALTIGTSPPFVPGPSDTRELGVQVDRISCIPDAGAWIRPPGRALVTLAGAGAALGSIFAVFSPTLVTALFASAMFGAALGYVVHTGAAMFSRPYLEWMVPVAVWIAIPLLGFAAFRWWRERPIHPATGFVLVFSAAVLCIKIVTLLHPSKDVVDAVFHAHRLGWVLEGRYYFTQPMPGGVAFPYAIGLYVTAAPWAGLMPDHVTLLRIVVCVAEAVAAAGLYLAVSRIWRDRFAGALAVLFYHLAPLPYVVVGNANLTFAFGQSVAAMAATAAATLTLGRRNILAFACVCAAALLAFLSHVAIFPILAVSLITMSGLYWLRGDPALRGTAIGIALATSLATVVAVGAYYAHFPEVQASLGRVTRSADGQASTPPDSGSAPQRSALTVGARATRAAVLGLDGIGWPIVALAALGAWLLWVGPRDRLTLALCACSASFALFVLFRILAPVDGRYQRYADEFIDRMYYATLPVFAILAGRAAAWGWRAGIPQRWIAAGLLVGAAVLGTGKWSGWIGP